MSTASPDNSVLGRPGRAAPKGSVGGGRRPRPKLGLTKRIQSDGGSFGRSSRLGPGSGGAASSPVAGRKGRGSLCGQPESSGG